MLKISGQQRWLKPTKQRHNQDQGSSTKCQIIILKEICRIGNQYGVYTKGCTNTI